MKKLIFVGLRCVEENLSNSGMPLLRCIAQGNL